MKYVESDPQLVPGSGPYPSYGLEDSEASDSNETSDDVDEKPLLVGSVQPSKERVWVVAAFCCIVCFDSLTTGLMLSYSSATALELAADYENGDTVQGVKDRSTIASLFGVRLRFDMTIAELQGRVRLVACLGGHWCAFNTCQGVQYSIPMHTRFRNHGFFSSNF